MNCDGIKDAFLEGRLLTAEAQDHLAACARCRAIMEALTRAPADPDRTRLREIQALITASLKPVRPLPSDRTLAGALLGLFTAFSLNAAMPVRYYGFHALNVYQRLAYYTFILLCALWYSTSATEQMIPGSKQRTIPRWTILVSTLSLALLVSLLFHDFDLGRFVPLGIPCLRLGSICAFISGTLFWFVLKRGFFASPVVAGTIIGCFAGLAGVAVLALHCPIENSAHIILWHLGVMVLGGLGGAIVGRLPLHL
jgi:hypothetical protein